MAEYLHGTIGRALAALALALLGGIVVVTALPDLAVPLEPGEAPWWLVGVAFMCAEAFVLLTRGRVSVVALSPHAAILGVALFLLDPAGLFAAQLAGVVMVLVAFGVGRREAAVRLGTTTGITALALAIFLAFGAVADLSGPVGWLAAGVAVTVATAAPLSVQPLWLESSRWARERDGPTSRPGSWCSVRSRASASRSWFSSSSASTILSRLSSSSCPSSRARPPSGRRHLSTGGLSLFGTSPTRSVGRTRRPDATRA